MYSTQLNAHATSTAISVNTNEACYETAVTVAAAKTINERWHAVVGSAQ
jgi:hypothetical protein